MKDLTRTGETFRYFNKQTSLDGFELKDEDTLNPDEKSQVFQESQTRDADRLCELSSNRQ